MDTGTPSIWPIIQDDNPLKTNRIFYLNAQIEVLDLILNRGGQITHGYIKRIRKDRLTESGLLINDKGIPVGAAGIMVDFWITKGGKELGHLIRTKWHLPFLPRVGETIGIDYLLTNKELKPYSGTLYKVTDLCWFDRSVTIDCESE